MLVSAKLGNEIKKVLSVEHVLPVARGTTAMWLALRVLGERQRRVLVPANVCESVIAAILAADMEPAYVDVDPVQGLITANTLDAAFDEQCVGLIAVHNFGTPLAMTEISDWCRKYDIFLLEDCCNAVGATAEGRPVGSWGEAAAYSFGSGKNLDLARGGLLAFQDRYALLEAGELADLIPPWTLDSERAEKQRQRQLRQLRNAGEPVPSSVYRALFPKGDSSLFARVDDDWHDELTTGMKSLPGEIDKRNRNAAYYREFLDHEKIRHRRMIEGEACWRYTFHVPASIRNHVVRELRAQDLPVSTWYPSVDAKFGPMLGPDRLPGAYQFESTVINLFVDATVSPSTREACCRLVQTALDTDNEDV
ncbi:MAG: DegT/DnrJ/EryC1/StrS family aminotransferase [Phycisphaerae bacterium]